MGLSFIQCTVIQLSQVKETKAFFAGERDESQHFFHQDECHTLQLKGLCSVPETNMGSIAGDILEAKPRTDGEQRS